MLFTPEGLRHLIAEVGVSRVMIGTDGNPLEPRLH
jgi:hypothetical protein